MTPSSHLGRVLRIALLGLVAFLSTGCTGDYVLRGVALRGDYSIMEFIARSDDLDEGAALPGARISIWRDPDQLNRQLVASGTSRADGTFSIPIDSFGAGWMEEQWLVRVVRTDYQTIEQMVVFPKDDDERRLLVVMSPGESIVPPGEDLWEEYERFR